MLTQVLLHPVLEKHVLHVEQRKRRRKQISSQSNKHLPLLFIAQRLRDQLLNHLQDLPRPRKQFTNQLQHYLLVLLHKLTTQTPENQHQTNYTTLVLTVNQEQFFNLQQSLLQQAFSQQTKHVTLSQIEQCYRVSR